jgi:hypothetical protein
MQAQSQHIVRVNKLDNNLKDQIDWLSLNLEKSYFSGFNYAHKVSKDISAPPVFNFDNPSKRASNSSTLASISEIGDFELQSFRINSNLRSDNQRDSAERPANANGHALNSSASFSYDAEEHLNGGDQEQHRNSSSSYRSRPSVGSFLGGQGAANGYLLGDRSRDREDGRQSGSGNGNFIRSNNNNSSSSSSSGYGDQSGNSSSSSSSGYNNMSRGLHTGSSSANSSYGTARDPPSSSSSSSSSFSGPVEAYSTCISDSQLAVLDIEGNTCAPLTATDLYLSGLTPI